MAKRHAPGPASSGTRVGAWFGHGVGRGKQLGKIHSGRDDRGELRGLSPEGGSTGAQHSTRVTEPGLDEHLQVIRNPGASRRGYFLRAETMHGFYTYLENNPGIRLEPRFHDMSHGGSFLELILDRFREDGLWVLDEPESALSLSGCLALVGILKDLRATGESQVIRSTRSPLLAALPGADIYEVGPWGLRNSE